MVTHAIFRAFTHLCKTPTIRTNAGKKRTSKPNNNNIERLSQPATQNKCQNNRLLIEWYLNARATICLWIFYLTFTRLARVCVWVHVFAVFFFFLEKMIWMRVANMYTPSSSSSLPPPPPSSTSSLFTGQSTTRFCVANIIVFFFVFPLLFSYFDSLPLSHTHSCPLLALVLLIFRMPCLPCVCNRTFITCWFV